MANSKNTLVTPRGTALYPKIDQPYKYSEAANRSVPDPDGEFELRVIFDAEATETIKSAVKMWASNHDNPKVSKAKKMPWRPEVQDGEETDRFVVTFKQYGKDKEGRKRTIAQFDAKANKLPASFKLTNGSEVKVNFHPYYYSAQGGGIKLYLDAVQVLKYVPMQERSVFDQEDDGFVYEDEVESNTTNDEEGFIEEEDDEIPF